MQEILVILVLALIFLGPKKLPELASGIGKAIREVRKATADIKSEIELDDVIRKPLEELREATMLPPEELKRRDEERKWRAQREKEDAEARARGEDPYAVAETPAEDYHEPGDGYDDEHTDSSYADAHDDPQSHSPDSNTGELTVGDLEPVKTPVSAPKPTAPLAATGSAPKRSLTPP